MDWYKLPPCQVNNLYLNPDDISQQSLFTGLPEDIHRLIALHLDYDDLINYLQVQKSLWLLGKEEGFWPNKIYHDFGINNRDTDAQSYVKIAAEHYYPVKGCHKYARSFRDIFRLLYNANRLGKSLKFLQDKISQFDTPADVINVLKIGSLIGTRTLNLDEIANIVKSQFEGSEYYHNLAAILRGEKHLVPEVICWRNTIIYASLFDRLDIIKEFFSSGELKYDVAVSVSNSSIVEIIHDWDPEGFSSRMLYLVYQTIHMTNIEALKKLVDLGLTIDQEVVRLAINSNCRQMVTYVLSCCSNNLAKFTLDQFLYTSVKYNYLESADVLLELGADINSALYGAVANNHSMIITYINSGASDLNGALMHAIKEYQVDAAKVLINAGATNMDQAVETLMACNGFHIEITKNRMMTVLVESGKVNIETTMVKLINKYIHGGYYDNEEKIIDILIQAGANNLDQMLSRLIKEYSTRDNRNYLQLIDKIISSQVINRERAWKLAMKYNNDDVLNLLSI